MTTTRDSILADVRSALGRRAGQPVPPVPGRMSPRTPGDPAAELDMFLGEIGKLGGHTAKVSPDGLADALAALVRDEDVKKATLWPIPALAELCVAEALTRLGVEIVSPYAGKEALATCDLGITAADHAFPETGTMLLRSTPERPRMVSLVPRVHLALIDPGILRADLSPAFEQVKGEGYFVFVTGPSRTADIELTVTIGVHGPKALYVWAVV